MFPENMVRYESAQASTAHTKPTVKSLPRNVSVV